MFRRIAIPISIAVVVAACSQEADEKEVSAESAETVTNCGEEYTYSNPPERIITTSLPATELVLALGLRDRLVGTVPAKDLRAEFAGQLDGVPLIANRAFPPPGREAVLAAQPDIVIGGYPDDFGDQAVGNRTELRNRGVNSYLVQGGCSGETAEVEDTLVDIETLGRIFDVEDKAQEVSDRIRDSLPTPPTGEAVPVFIYEGGEGKPLTDGKGPLINDLLRVAGGRNVFADAAPFGEVSWEEVVARNPEVIVIVAQDGFVDPEKAQEDLKANPALRGVTAVREGNFVTVGVNDTQPGIRVADTTRLLNEGLAQ